MDVVQRGAAGAYRRGFLSELDAWLAATFDHRPRDAQQWRRALTHGSRDDQASYERLEFLGDRVLGLCVAEWLYELFPHEPEGMLSRRINILVSGATCAEVGRAIALPERVMIGKGAKATTRDSDHVLGDVVEALLGALYLEAGLDAARRWVRTHWAERIHSKASARKHPKAALQEWSEANGRGLPVYTAATEAGPGTSPLHRVSVRVGQAEEVATASTKREAETLAATALMQALLAEAPRRRAPVSVRNPILKKAAT